MKIVNNLIKIVFGIPDSDPIPPFQVWVFFVLMTVAVIVFVTLG
jgi:hypothetical protein